METLCTENEMRFYDGTIVENSCTVLGTIVQIIHVQRIHVLC